MTGYGEDRLQQSEACFEVVLDGLLRDSGQPAWEGKQAGKLSNVWFPGDSLVPEVKPQDPLVRVKQNPASQRPLRLVHMGRPVTRCLSVTHSPSMDG